MRDDRLRHAPRHLGRGRARRPGARPRARDPAARPVPRRGRQARRRHGACPATPRSTGAIEFRPARSVRVRSVLTCEFPGVAGALGARPCESDAAVRAGAAAAATARCSPPASSSTSARPSASSPPSRSASPARSSRCGRSTPVASRVRTSPTACPASSSCSRPARPRAPRSSPSAPASSASARTRRASAPSPSSPTTATEEEHVVSHAGAPRARSPTAPEVAAGDQLTGDAKTPLDPKKILEIEGIRETQQYLADEVQKVYREQGVSIHDKHVEVDRPPDAAPGRGVGAGRLGVPAGPEGRRPRVRRREQAAREPRASAPAEGRPELMGITKASLATDSWLSAASFQETTRVLTEAAIEGKNDGLERSQGERHHREAHPGRDRACRSTATSTPRRPTTSRCPSTQRLRGRLDLAERSGSLGQPSTTRRPRPGDGRSPARWRRGWRVSAAVPAARPTPIADPGRPRRPSPSPTTASPEEHAAGSSCRTGRRQCTWRSARAPRRVTTRPGVLGRDDPST